METSYDQFAGRAIVTHVLPLLAKRFARHFAGDRVVAWSGGSEPGSELNPRRRRRPVTT